MAPAPRRGARAVPAALVLALAATLVPPLPRASAWPLFYNGSGTTQLSSAFGGDVLLSPSTGACAARAGERSL